MNLPHPTIEDLFFAASERQDPAARAAYLDEACGRDTDLRRRLEDLLAAEPKVNQFLESPAVTSPIEFGPVVGDESLGTVIGPYKLLEPIGEGGMGVVYLAEQTQPVRRKVALKIIKPGMDTKQVIARFEAERQALALMDHPNIAKVHDAGATESRPPLLRHGAGPRHPDHRVLRPRAALHPRAAGAVRARLPGRAACPPEGDHPPRPQALEHPGDDHDGVAVPKIIDFGVAKATGQSLTDQTLFTGFAQLIGTPLYMSPEQAELGGLDVDTRSDIYSLGAVALRAADRLDAVRRADLPSGRRSTRSAASSASRSRPGRARG